MDLFQKKFTSLGFTHTLQKSESKFFSLFWLKHIDKHPFIFIAKLIAFLLTHKKIRLSFKRKIPGLKIFLLIYFSRERTSTSAILHTTLFSSINFELFRVINISICTRESYITESDMVQMKIYTFKKRHGKRRWQSCLVCASSK